jgi:nucleoside-diphosphate-sugar epimerase
MEFWKSPMENLEIIKNNKSMKILITGNLGYVGSVLVDYLRKKYQDIYIIGYDIGYFAHCLNEKDFLPEISCDKQYFGDIRNFPEDLLTNIDAVVHLSAISNDPMGKEFEKVTYDINLQASVNFANKASNKGVKNFVFASSCSVYGSASEMPKSENDLTDPLTAYAISKINLEKELKNISSNSNMVITCLRFATACGYSRRLRLDLVLNDFVSSAIFNGEINVLSDGSPWRPLIDVKDMSLAIDWASKREKDNGGKFLFINTGSNKNNFQVKELASLVNAVIPNLKVNINTNALPDKRSYKVDFSLFEQLAPDFTPKININQSIDELINGISKLSMNFDDFRDSEYMRLNTLRSHIKANRLNKDLKWTFKI